MNIEQEREISSFVSREVIYCVSSLINTLQTTMMNEGCELSDGTSYDDFYRICVQEDYETPAREHIRRGMDRDETVEALESIGDGAEHEGMSDDELTLRLLTCLEDNGDWREFCDSNDIAPYTVEAYEHWIVSNWLAGKLEAKGEMIGRGICGLTIWGRTTTGQAISMDSVIQEIYNELHGEYP